MLLEARGFGAMSASVMKELASLDASLSLRSGIFRPPGCEPLVLLQNPEQ